MRTRCGRQLQTGRDFKSHDALRGSSSPWKGTSEIGKSGPAGEQSTRSPNYGVWGGVSGSVEAKRLPHGQSSKLRVHGTQRRLVRKYSIKIRDAAPFGHSGTRVRACSKAPHGPGEHSFGGDAQKGDPGCEGHGGHPALEGPLVKPAGP